MPAEQREAADAPRSGVGARRAAPRAHQPAVLAAAAEIRPDPLRHLRVRARRRRRRPAPRGHREVRARHHHRHGHAKRRARPAVGGIENSSEVPKFRGSEVPGFEVARFEVRGSRLGLATQRPLPRTMSSTSNEPELRNFGTSELRNLGAGPRLAARAVACLSECHHEDAERDPRCGDPLHPSARRPRAVRSTRKVAAIPIPITPVSAAASIAAAIRTPPTPAASTMAIGRAWTRRATATVTTSGAKASTAAPIAATTAATGRASEWQHVYRDGFTQGYDQGYRDGRYRDNNGRYRR